MKAKMNRLQRILAATYCLLAASACRNSAMSKVTYASTPKGDVVEDYFGTKIADPYRWMEDLDSKAVADWVAAQNQVTFDYLAKLPMREHFVKRIQNSGTIRGCRFPFAKAAAISTRKTAGFNASPLSTCARV